MQYGKRIPKGYPIDTFVFKTAKYDTWSIFFDQVSYFFHKKNRPSVAFGRFFRPSVVFDLQSYSTKGFSTKSRAPTIQNTSISKTFFTLNSTNIPTIVVILTFMRRMNSVFECLKAKQSLLCSILFL